jgi:Carboxylesterase family
MKSLVLFSFVYGSAVTSAFNFASLSSRQTAIKTVNTTSGLISGHASSNASAQVSEYLGIPYAEPPVRYSGSSGINGTNFVGTS